VPLLSPRVKILKDFFDEAVPCAISTNGAQNNSTMKNFTFNEFVDASPFAKAGKSNY
jgi:hypothetical protein